MLQTGQTFGVYEVLPTDRYKEHKTGSWVDGIPDELCNTLTKLLGRYSYTFDDHLSKCGIGQDVKPIGRLIITKVK